MSNFRAGLSLAGLLFYCGSAAVSQPPSVPIAARAALIQDGAPVVIPRAKQYDLTSRITGRTYRIMVATPFKADPAIAYPVVYLLDGSQAFGTAAATRQFLNAVTAPAIIVGVGYPTDNPPELSRIRFLDLTPSVSKAEDDAGRKTGEGDAFLRAIEEEVKPFVMARYKIDAAQQIFYGHSLGGLMVLRTLFRNPNAFSTYIASSPSIWWNNNEVLADEASFSKRARAGELHMKLLITSAVRRTISRRRPDASCYSCGNRQDGRQRFGTGGSAGCSESEEYSCRARDLCRRSAHQRATRFDQPCASFCLAAGTEEMTIAIGSKLGPYEILSAIGAGGMGEVWKARDTRIDRLVAVKTSHAKFTDRFAQEVRAIAALNHPHICTLYDVGPDYLVMEYVEGSEIKGPLPLDVTLKYAIQLASALEAAHRKGITHRDLKPANILVTKAGIKVLDFGLAKFEQSKAAVANDETLTRALTQEGSIVGTLQYMAPEQLQGKATDARADFFSFGCVLFEMLTGKRAFDGANTASVIAGVLEREPPSMGEVAPASLDWAMRVCLAKDPDERWQSARDLRRALERVTATENVERRSLQSRFGRTAWGVAALGIIVAAGLAFIHFRELPPDQPVIFSNIAIPENSNLGFLALSPDGRRLVVGLRLAGAPNSQLYVRSLDSSELIPLANTDSARAPFWSPDGKNIGFSAAGKLKTIPVGGGIARSLCNPGDGIGGAWSPDGVIVIGNRNTGLVSRVNASGGPCVPVTKAETGWNAGRPAFLRDGKHFLYRLQAPDESKNGVYLASLADPKPIRLLTELSDVIYAPPLPGSRYGHLLFLRESRLMAQPFDDRALQLAGDAVVVVEQATLNPNSQPFVSVSASGILAYAGNLSRNGQLTWFDRTGKEVETVGSGGIQRGIAVSPDGKSVAMTVIKNGVQSINLRSLTGNSQSLLAEAGSAPVWSPDGARVVYSNNNDLYVRDTAGGGETVLLHTANPKSASDWSRDGRYLLYNEGPDIWYLENPLAGEGRNKPVLFVHTDAPAGEAQFSPDGRWVAYFSSNNNGNIVIRSFPAGSRQWQVSTNKGGDPHWAADGKEIYYIERGLPNKLMAVPVRFGGGDTPEIGAPRKIFEFRALLWVPTLNLFAYSVGPDGRFLVDVSTDTGTPTINLITNWQKLLNK